MADLTGPNPDEVNGVDANGATITGKPVLIGGYASAAAPSSVSTGQAVNLWTSLFGAVNVILRDTSGTAVATDTQYVGDAAATSTPTGTIIMGRASAAAPSNVSADDDAVAAWALRNGSLVVNLASGGTLIPVGQAAMAASLPVVIASNQSAISVDTELTAVAALADATANPTITNIASLPFVFNGTTWDRQRSGGVTGMAGVGGDTAAAATDAGNPVKVGGYGSAAIPSAVTDGQRVNAWFGTRGQLNTQMVDGSGNVISNSSPTDAFSNATALRTTTQLLGYNGTTWDRSVTTQAVTAGANTDRGIMAAGIGPGFSRIPADDSLSSVTAGAAIDVGGAGTVALQITGGATATITFEASYDNVTYFAVLAQNQATNAWASTTTTNGNFLIPVEGYYRVRANMTARTSGTFTVHKVVHLAQIFQQITGDTANDAIDALSNPVKIGGVANTSAPAAVSAGDRVTGWFDTNGRQVVAVAASAAVSVTGDGQANWAVPSLLGGGTTPEVGGGVWLYNGSTVDRARSAAGVTGSVAVGGLTASDAVLASAPVTIGGRASQALPTAMSADGDVVDVWLSRVGTVMVGILGSTTSFGGDANAMGTLQSPTGNQITSIPVGTHLFNGSNWDRLRSVLGVTVGSNTDLGITAAGIGPGFSRIPGDDVLASVTAGAGVSVGGAQTVIFQVTGGATATITFEATYDATTWFAVSVQNTSTGAWGTTTTANGNFALPVDGYYQVRANMTARTSGTFTVHKVVHTSEYTTAAAGDTPHDGVDFGNPIKIGGYASSTFPTAVSSSGDRTNAWFGTGGQLMVGIVGTGGGGQTAGGDANLQQGFPTAAANSYAVAPIGTAAYAYNGGGSWDRIRTATPFIAAPAAAALNVGTSATGIVDADSNYLVGVTPHREQYVGQRQTLLSDQFSDAFRANLWTTANANGGTTTYASGEVTAATSANANGSSVSTSTVSIPLEPGAVYLFSAWARFGDTGLASNNRRLGPFTQSAGAPQDGYYFQLNGTTFQAVSAKAASATAVSEASFTRHASAPFTLDTNYHLFEIEVANDLVYFIIDGVIRHILPQSVATARTATLTLPITLQTVNAGSTATNATLVARSVALSKVGDLSKTVGNLQTAPNNDANVTAVGVGPGYDRKTDPAGIVSTSTANAITVPVNGADMVTFEVMAIGTTPGSMIIETSADDSTWNTAGMVIKAATGPDTRVEGSFVPAVGDVYFIRTTGLRQVRYRVNAVYASGTSTIKVTAAQGTGMLKSMDMAPTPHNIGYALVGVSAQYTTAQTSTIIGPTVAAGQRMVVTYVQIQAGGTVAGTQVSVYFGTSTYVRGTNKAVFDGEFAPSSTLKPGAIMSPPVPFMGAADEELRITNVGAINPLTITIWYYLVAA